MQGIKVAPVWLYQRYRPFFDRLVPALGMAFLFALTDQATGAFSSEWRLFIAGGVLVAGLVAPVAGYILFVLALAYPLYSISIYVAALALAILILLSFFLLPSPRRGGAGVTAIVLVLATPLLATYRIAPVALFLAGLWWAEWGGVLVGMGSALWLKTFAGMCGATLDLTQLGGQSFEVHQLIARFQTANSWQTLLWLAEPWMGAPLDSRTLLLHILEVLGWGLAGYGVGLVRQRMEGLPRLNVGLLLLASVGAGLLGIGVGSLVLPMVFGLRKVSALPTFSLLGFLVEYCWGGAIAIGLYGVSRYLTRPVVMPAPSRTEPSHSPVRPMPEPAPRPFVRPQARADEDELADIIMIDLD